MDKALIDIINLISSTGTWLRYALMLLSFGLGAYIILRSGTEKSLANTINAQKDELNIKNTRIETLISEIKKADEKAKALELEAATLKTKTDLTEVIRMLGSISESFGREHANNLEMLQIVVKNIQEQQSTTTEQLTANSKFLREIFDYIKEAYPPKRRAKRRDPTS